MNMTEAQRLTLKSFVQNDVTLNGHFAAGRYDELATALNAAAAGPWVVWQSNVSTDLVAGIVSLSVYTPADPVPANGTTTTVTNNQLFYQNNAFACQLKQANILTLAFGAARTLVTAKTNVRQALNDALTNVPSGASAALQDAGWLGAGKVRLSIQRNASVAEKTLSSGTGTQATPADLGVVDAINNIYAEGTIVAGDIGRLMS